MEGAERDKLMLQQRISSLDFILDDDDELDDDDTDDDAVKTKREAFRNLKQDSSASIDFDDLLPHVGEFGKYQKLLVFLVCLPACIPCGIHAFSQLFMSPVPDHWCRVGGPQFRTAIADILRTQQLETLQLENPAVTTTPELTESLIDNLTESIIKDFDSGKSNTEGSTGMSSTENPTELITEAPITSTTFRGRHHHQQKHIKKQKKYFTFPSLLESNNNGFHNNNSNNSSHGSRTVQNSRKFLMNPLRPLVEAAPRGSINVVRRSRGADETSHNRNIIRHGKYVLTEEEGHENHSHLDDDQVLNIFAAITALEQKLEIRFSLAEEKSSGELQVTSDSTNEEKIRTAYNFYSPLHPRENIESEQALNPDSFSLYLPQTDGSTTYNIPILTPSLKLNETDSKLYDQTISDRQVKFHPSGNQEGIAANRRKYRANTAFRDNGSENTSASYIAATSTFYNNPSMEIKNSKVRWLRAYAEDEDSIERPMGKERTIRGDTEDGKFMETTMRMETEDEDTLDDTDYLVENTTIPVEDNDSNRQTETVNIRAEDFQLRVEKYIRDIYIPKEASGKYSCCQKYDIEPSTALTAANTTQAWPVVDCNHEWVFDTSTVKSSIVMDFTLVCHRAIYPTIALAVLNIGGIIGVYFFGSLSDRFGRRASFLLCLGTEQVFALATAAAPTYEWWLACRFFVGLTIPAIYQIPFIISMELVGPNYRSFVTVLTCFFYVSGMMILSGVAYLVRDWQLLCVVTSLPFFTYIIYWWFLPESPRWLLGRGRLHEAGLILQRMARVNGARLPESFQQKLSSRMLAQQAASRGSSKISSNVDTTDKAGFCGLWATPNMRRKTLLIILVWFANETVYVGLSYYGPVMGDNEHLAFFLSCLVEVPSYLLCWVVMDRWGRRWILGVGMIVGGLCSVATVVTPAQSSVMAQSFYLVAKFAESAAFLIIYPFSAELFPTAVRGVGIGFAAYVGGIGLVVIPFINYLGSEMLSLPLLIMGLLSVVGGVAAFRLPETLHQPLPNSLKEGEQFGASFSWADCCSCKPKRDESDDKESFTAHESRKYRDEIIDLTNLNLISSEEGRQTRQNRRCRPTSSLLADESDYATENEYSIDEDPSSGDSGPGARDTGPGARDTSPGARDTDQRSSFKRRKMASRRGQYSRALSQFADEKQELERPLKRFLSSHSERSRTVDLSSLDEIAPFSPTLRHGDGRMFLASGSSRDAMAIDSTSREMPRPEEALRHIRAPIKKGKLVKQASIVPIITDSSGAMKMTFWM
ncbi:uncharacterized protein LOC108681637 [Hyalella azteca]|uniref:Uncharacterized protein LOC108681637 n=1 Tax=Hyalella azteca TaxID=294128 RepID=A0A8B7PJ31_HYAAZ|nr:uncharacterized protein LOC108681637 [Hyalella azteca]